MKLLRWLPPAEQPAPAIEERRRNVLATARALRVVCRERELLARTQGLEFEIMVPEGGRGRAEQIGERIRKHVLESPDVPRRLRIARGLGNP